MTLQAAVPLLIAELLELPGAARRGRALAWVAESVDEVASKGDVLQYGGAKGEAAKVFAHTARGLAALALAPRGVVFAGLHWCVDHPMGVQREAADVDCRRSGMS